MVQCGFWTHGSLSVIGLFESQMILSTIILTNNYDTSNAQIPSGIIVKGEHIDVLVSFGYENEICIVVNFSYTLPFAFTSTISIPSKLQGDPFKHPYNPLYMREAHHNTSSQRPSLRTYPSSIILSIGDALKLTKFGNRSKSEIASIDVDNLEM